MAADDAKQREMNRRRLPTAPTHSPALMFGVPITNISIDEAIDRIAALVEIGRLDGRTHQVTTVNVDFLVNGMEHPDVAGILQSADLCLPDGMPVVWASRLLGMPVRERVAGADLVPLLVGASAERGWHVHVFGSTPTVAEQATAILSSRFPGARFSIESGPRIDDVTQVSHEVLDAIAAVDADILCVALGNPKQERFIATHRNHLRVPVMIGIGGSLDMLVGHRPRAPRWMQALGLEWVWRARLEPRRLGARYLHDIRVFAPALLAEWRRHRRRRNGCGLQVTSTAPGQIDVALAGNGRLSESQWRNMATRLASGAGLAVTEVAGTPHDVALAQLVGLILAARHGGGSIRWPADEPSWAHEFGLGETVLGLPAR